MLQIEKTRINQVTVVKKVRQTIASKNSELPEITIEARALDISFLQPLKRWLKLALIFLALL